MGTHTDACVVGGGLRHYATALTPTPIADEETEAQGSYDAYTSRKLYKGAVTGQQTRASGPPGRAPRTHAGPCRILAGCCITGRGLERTGAQGSHGTAHLAQEMLFPQQDFVKAGKRN